MDIAFPRLIHNEYERTVPRAITPVALTGHRYSPRLAYLPLSTLFMRTLGLLVALFAPILAAGAQAAHAGDWVAYGRDQFGSRYSPLAQVNRDNVGELAVAWTYRTGEMEQTRQPIKLEATPLVVDGMI